MNDLLIERYEDLEQPKEEKSHREEKILLAILLVAMLSLTSGVLYFALRHRGTIQVLKNKRLTASYSSANRQIIHWNFSKDYIESKDNKVKMLSVEQVTVPHTWNNKDGQEGDDKYYRGRCVYQTVFSIDKSEKNKNVYVEFFGSSTLTSVIVNGHFAGNHFGGFTSFRYDVTEFIDFGSENNVLTVFVANNETNLVYPKKMDIATFGGLYRNVNFLFKNKSHFDLSDHGSYGLYIDTSVAEGKGVANMSVIVKPESHDLKYKLKYSFFDKDGKVIHSEEKESTNKDHLWSQHIIEKPNLWEGRKNPYLYSGKVELIVNGAITDVVTSRFGFRTVKVTKEGFFLNGEKMKLKGVSRHQDRLDKGWAITNEDDKEDFDLILEVGAESLRMNPYVHNQTVFDMCDEHGIILWVTAPMCAKFIDNEASSHNLKTELKEIIKQNYNRPSVCIMSLFNEVGELSEPKTLVALVQEMNNISHTLKPDWLTSASLISDTNPKFKIAQTPDIIGYNLYGGWYGGDVKDNAATIDRLIKVEGLGPLAVSEYGAETNLEYHSDNPKRMDYTEEYQLYFHMKYYEIIQAKNIWAGYVWNMFDFASPTRNEGGYKGRNQKGLITYDRKTKKDSFFFYKAMWSSDPFVHVCGARFRNRTKENINVIFFSNQLTLKIYVNGDLFKDLNNFNKTATFSIKLNKGVNIVKATSNQLSHSVEFERFEEK